MSTGMNAMTRLTVRRSSNAANWTTRTSHSGSPNAAGLSMVQIFQSCFHIDDPASAATPADIPRDGAHVRFARHGWDVADFARFASFRTRDERCRFASRSRSRQHVGKATMNWQLALWSGLGAAALLVTTGAGWILSLPPAPSFTAPPSI